jgi:uncharacterized protein YfeS
MKAYQELNLKLKKVSDAEFIEIIKYFTQQVNDWTYIQKESEEHTEETRKPSCIIFLDDDYHKPKFLITKRKDKFYSIVNIFNSQHGYIPMLEYNVLLRRFNQDFKSFITSASYKMSVELSKEDIGLNELITSPKAREYFEKYLNFRPQISNLHDQDRLDYFICAVSRFYKKKKISTELIKRYLIEELNWRDEDAEWCRNRIDVGLEILEVNKKLYL